MGAGVVLPGVIAHAGWDDAVGGVLYAGFARTVVGWMLTLSVNSLGHSLGTQPFVAGVTATDNPWLAAVTLGEGYHNYHHAFPTDYRHGVDTCAVDMTKWVIWGFEKLGWAWDLHRARPVDVDRCRKLQLRRGLDFRETDWMVLSWEGISRRVEQGCSLVVVDRAVYDVAGFVDVHPGGRALLQREIGKDVTALFYDGSHVHSEFARYSLQTMQVGVLQGKKVR
ncbi:cytochrome b5 [Aspergillus campestris IBT 28561]|uniref:Cytochrome b5 n=1 Tax=Aspergillus campestris (strain IBT 28561) TaxID=1392248 RepID=A0A2I1CTQ9_ASPC2|nr:cytochrome b5 [Aspergillus campestris IBT 28561]PKY01008.1 cytochrome b5 [Aspergillus campestris IBT 28561]